MASQLPPIAVFDLDGTLADTAPDLLGTLNVVLAGEGLPPLPMEEARELIGAGARALVEQGFAAAEREITPALLDRLYRDFLVHYADNICVASALFPGARDALDELEGQGFRLAVCTNKLDLHAGKLLAKLDVAHRFAAICGRDAFLYFKPDPRHLTLTIEKAGGDPKRAVMVGDSRTDIVTAQAAGIPVVGVTFGYTDTPVRDLGPDIAIDHFDELVPAIRRLIGGDGGRDRD